MYVALSLGYPVVQRYRDLSWKTGSETVALLSFDIDYRKDEDSLPRLVRVLKECDVQASFACVGAHVARRPAPYQMLNGEGHELLNHTYTHPHNKELSPNRKWSQLSWAEKGEEISHCQDVLEKATKVRPMGFRLPHFGSVQGDANPTYYSLLSKMGFLYSSSVLDFMQRGKPWVKIEPAGIVEIAITTCPFHPFTAMDSYHIVRSKRWFYRMIHSRIDLARALNRAVEICRSRHLSLNIYLDPLDVNGDELSPLLARIRDLGVRFLRYTDFCREALERG